MGVSVRRWTGSALAMGLLAAGALLVPGSASAAAANSVTICHATGAASPAYVTNTVSANALNGHSGHSGDIIPAPATGCPTTATTTTTTTTTGTTTTPTPTPGTKVTICHATGSATNPYETNTIDSSGLNGHADHAEDLILAPAGGCPTPPPPTTPAPGAPYTCTASSPVLMFASGRNAVTLRSCQGTSLRLWGDPWVTWSEPGLAQPLVFPVGFGSPTLTLPGDASVQFTTDPLARNATASVSVTGGPAWARITRTVTTLAYPVAADRSPAVRGTLAPLTSAQLTQLRDALQRCSGDTQRPFTCSATAPTGSTVQPPLTPPAPPTATPAPPKAATPPPAPAPKPAPKAAPKQTPPPAAKARR